MPKEFSTNNLHTSAITQVRKKQYLCNPIMAAIITLAAPLFSPIKASGQTFPACPVSGSTTDAVMQTTYLNGCRGTPSNYEVTFYEMGICTSNPTSGNTFNPASCINIFKNASGLKVDLGNGGSVKLNQLEEKPAGTFTHAYVILGNTFIVRGSYSTSDGGTWYTDGQDPDEAAGGINAKNTAPAVAFPDVLTTFGPNNQPCQTVSNVDVPNGSLDALLVDSSLNQSCTSAAKIIATFTPASPIVIDRNSGISGLDATFTVTNNGMFVVPNNPGTPGIMAFGGGPFNPTFRIIREGN